MTRKIKIKLQKTMKHLNNMLKIFQVKMHIIISLYVRVILIMKRKTYMMYFIIIILMITIINGLDFLFHGKLQQTRQLPLQVKILSTIQKLQKYIKRTTTLKFQQKIIVIVVIKIKVINTTVKKLLLLPISML